jgi:phage-related protein
MPLTWEILLFEDTEGIVPVRDYLLTLKQGEQKRFQVALKRLADIGLQAGYPYSDKLEDNLYELRLANSPHNPRFLYCAVIDRRLYLLHGFSKTGQKSDLVPESEKIIARKRRDQLLKRIEAEQIAIQQTQIPKSKKKR